MNATKRRKVIRLKDYDYSSNGYYFVTICTDFRKPFLKNKKIKEIVVAELARLPNRFKGLKIDYYTIVSNHLHMILHLENSKYSLPKIIQAFKSLTTLKAKQSLPLHHLWQPNYYEHVIRTDKALNKIREYVQNNPLAERLKFEELYEVMA
jgi:REP element-mobilizing transposase RayT